MNPLFLWLHGITMDGVIVAMCVTVIAVLTAVKFLLHKTFDETW